MKNLKLTHLLIFFILTISVVPTFNKVLAQSPNLTLEHLDLLVSLSSPKISPDGKKIILINTKADFDKNQYVNALWLVTKNTKEAKLLTYNRPSVRLPE